MTDKKYKILGFYIVILIFTFSFFNFAEAAIVPQCGGADQPACTYCNLLQLVKNVMDFMLYLVFPLATIGIIVGGFYIMMAAGSTSRVQKGRQYITAAVVGILIALLAWTVLDTILKVISPNFQAGSLGPWNQLNCKVLDAPTP